MRAFAFLVLSIVLAGCASSPHTGHMEGPALLLGFHNEQATEATLRWDLTNATNASVWSADARVPPGEIVERIRTLPAPGAYTLVVMPGDPAGFSIPFDTAECDHQMFHLVLDVGANGTHAQRMRECH